MVGPISRVAVYYTRLSMEVELIVLGHWQCTTLIVGSLYRGRATVVVLSYMGVASF